ncbi:hypothetical protein [uncultured Campylobacter sp.]|uniref:hypothetical protein n=1 Tax=uncultured Campylobacter sp. TaxID=218934 RepID=UPI00260DDC52|nr:hypothetical protein [uncultured Campylobacter sp.]
MIHHFADLLDRKDDYWAMVPNRERFAFALNGPVADKQSLRIATIGANTPFWEQIFECGDLQELTLHLPSKEQITALRRLRQLKRLRITRVQVKNIDFLAELPLLQELVLEYVSGFCDLSPLRELKNLRSAYFENLRRVIDFSGLGGIASLRYLCINGTLDWDQPIVDFEFLKGLCGLEVLKLTWIKCKAPYPALLPLAALKNLKKISLYLYAFAMEEYALAQLICEGVEGAQMPLAVEFKDTGYVYFLGRGSGYTKIGAKNELKRRAEFEQKFEACKQKAREILNL